MGAHHHARAPCPLVCEAEALGVALIDYGLKGWRGSAHLPHKTRNDRLSLPKSASKLDLVHPCEARASHVVLGLAEAWRPGASEE
jgi:hypothetical protein